MASITNKSGRVIGFGGEATLLPDETKTVSDNIAATAAVKCLESKGYISITFEAKTADTGATPKEAKGGRKPHKAEPITAEPITAEPIEVKVDAE